MQTRANIFSEAVVSTQSTGRRKYPFPPIMEDDTFDYAGDYEGNYEDNYGEEYPEYEDFEGDGELVDGDLGDYENAENSTDLEPQDILENAWLTAKEEEGEAQNKLLKKLLEKENELMDEKTKYGLKALKTLILNSFNAGKSADVLSYAEKMTKSYKQQMRENMQSITTLLEKLSDSPDLLRLADLVLEVVNPKDNKTKIKITLLKAKCLANKGGNDREIRAILDEAHDLCRNPDGSDNVGQSNLLLDIYGMKITMADEKENNKLLKVLFEKAVLLSTSGLASNTVLGVIFRAGGRSRMRDCKYADASQHFFEAFKNYDECRNADMAVECLKLLVFSTLLSGSKVNPFDDKRAASYGSRNEIKSYEKLVKDVLGRNIDGFENSIKPMVRDDVVKKYVVHLRRLVQKDVFLDLVKPYSNISVKFVASKIHATDEETEELLVELILDRKIEGVIDQSTGVVTMKRPHVVTENYYHNLNRVCNSVHNLTKTVLQSVN
eukprot:TRINITY_DN2786_c0_g1_i5.p1 TRINITY_DN2786_c0_g1~~TRINITY_DN2786_c0_g1_i5.p1  ORF type:complete len:494 (+),score=106.89 TRINITY_DN2786_c0_g1_i5:335-1816(+)